MKIWTALILTFMVCVLSGCCWRAGPPKTPDDEAIRAGEKALVLLRVGVDVGGEPADALTWIWLYTASLSRGEPLRYAYRATPSVDTRHAGWKYLILQPGETYYLRIGFPSSPFTPGMWFHAPRNKTLVYIGSVSSVCEGSMGFLDSPNAHSCTPLTIKDETGAAKTVAQNHFSAYGELSTSLMQPWPLTPDFRSQAVLDSVLPLSIAAESSKTVLAPDWYGKSFNKSMFLANPGGGSGPVGLLIIAAELAYLPVGLAIGTAGGAHSKGKWQPCVDRLSEELQNYDYAKQLETAINDALLVNGLEVADKIPEENTHGNTGNGRQNLILQVGINRVTLTECKEDWTFFVDTSIRASIKQPDGDYYLYDRVFGLQSNYYEYPYLSKMTISPPCRKIEEYCDAKGPMIIREQIISALNAATQQIASDLSPKLKKENITTGN